MARKKSQTGGRLFVFEGPDGVGKTALSTLTVGFLEGAGIKADYVSFPGREPSTVGQLVYDFHHSTVPCSATPTAVQALHVAAHADAIVRQIRPRLLDGVNVVLDRYWWSTWVYGVCAGVDRTTLRRLLAFEERVWGSTAPHAVILVDRKTPLGRPGEPLGRWRKLQAEYTRLAARERKTQTVEVLNNDGDITSAFQSAISIVGARLHPHQRVAAVRALAKPTFASVRPDTARVSRQQPASVSAIDRSTPTILLHLEPARPTRVLDTYWKFAAERQRIFFARAEGETQPWTSDPILREYKFTNAYRASDRVSQYLIRHVIYRDDLPGSLGEVFFRILLFKIFNKIETWFLLEEAVGPIRHATYSFDKYERVLDRAMREGRRIYSAAYIMPTGSQSNPEPRKHRLHLRLLERMMADGLPEKLAAAKSMHAAFDLFLAYPTIGPFLAYQFVTDINYSEITGFTERDFVVPGPGALDGIRKCFAGMGGLSHAEIIKFMMDIQEREFERLGLVFRTLWGRRLQLIDCQNLFCEVGKYSRVAHPDALGISGRTRIKQRFAENPEAIPYWYPPKWELNDKIFHWTSELTEKLCPAYPET